MRSKYDKLKLDYNNSLVILRSGAFYVAYVGDAEILHSIFDYQLKNERVGFPLKSIDKVKERLEELHINYIICDDDIINKTFDNNAYHIYYQEIKKKEFRKLSKELLMKRIDFLLESNPDNYDKIRRFIDEL